MLLGGQAGDGTPVALYALGCVPKVVEKRSPHSMGPHPSRNTAFIHFKITLTGLFRGPIHGLTLRRLKFEHVENTTWAWMVVPVCQAKYVVVVLQDINCSHRTGLY